MISPGKLCLARLGLATKLLLHRTRCLAVLASGANDEGSESTAWWHYCHQDDQVAVVIFSNIRRQFPHLICVVALSAEAVVGVTATMPATSCVSQASSSVLDALVV